MNKVVAESASSETDSHGALLDVSGLHVTFTRGESAVKVVRDVSLSLAKGQALGVLGESGSGKSVTVKSLLGLLPERSSQTTADKAEFRGTDLLRVSDRRRRMIVGPKMSIIFQDALSALNPVHPVGRQIGEMYRVHRGYSRSRAKKAAIEMMRRVRIPDPERRVDDYPHQFSGGMRQRICIAIALALDPDLVIADEPTTALDVTIQAQILDLLKEEQRRRGMGLILISHDISVISEMTDWVAVMYAGRVVEYGRTREILDNPAHPYTQGLSAASSTSEPGSPMITIPGLPPNVGDLPPGCSFAPRCTAAEDVCREIRPVLEPVESDRTSRSRTAACHFTEKVME